jgi:hypothetical protein
MSARDTLVTEVGAAFAILGLLLVFLPLFLDAVRQGEGGVATARQLRWRVVRSWFVPITIAVAAADGTAGVFTLWGTLSLAKATGVLLIVLTWLVVSLAAVAVASTG